MTDQVPLNAAEALVIARKAVEQRLGDTAALALLGAALRQSGAVEEAFAVLAPAMRELGRAGDRVGAPELTAEFLLARREMDRLAQSAFTQSQLLTALRLFAALHAAEPEDALNRTNAEAVARLVNRRTMSLYNQGLAAEAATIAGLVLKAMPDDLDARQIAALYEKEHGDIARAVGLIADVVAANPDFANVHVNLANAVEAALGQADAADAQGRPDEARRIRDEVAAVPPRLAGLDHPLGRMSYAPAQTADLRARARAVYAHVSGHILKEDLLPHLPADARIVDCGANDGRDTVELAELWPAGRLYAFEPLPAIFQELRRTVAGHANVSCHDVALADRDGTMTFHVSNPPFTGSSSLLAPKDIFDANRGTTFGQSIAVRTLTMDSWAAAHGVTGIDLLWLDMQGYELAAMRAAPRIMATVRAVYIEVSLVEFYHGCPLYPEVRGWMEAQGFQVVRELIPWRHSGNVLFVRNAAPRHLA
jgi:FkbM family methyltransferase